MLNKTSVVCLAACLSVASTQAFASDTTNALPHQDSAAGQVNISDHHRHLTFSKLAAINPPRSSNTGIKEIKNTTNSLESPENRFVKKSTNEFATLLPPT